MADDRKKDGAPDPRELEKTPAGKRPPPHVAEGPPPTPEGRREYDDDELRKSEDYAEERAEEGRKPYTTEAEAYRQAAEGGRPGGPDDRRSDEEQD